MTTKDDMRSQARGSASPRNVIKEIDEERQRQIEKEGWTPQHDDREHDQGALAHAAAAYALHAGNVVNPNRTGYYSPPPNFWPFDEEWWKPKDARRDLIRAAALIVAEIERLDRQKAASAARVEPSGETIPTSPPQTEGQ